MAWKHRLKQSLRSAYSGAVYHTGLWRVFHRIMRRRMVILAGHCVGPAPGLPRDMTLSPRRLEEIIAALSAGFVWRTVGQGGGPAAAEQPGPSFAALTFDDGYRDNFEVLLPILERTGAQATVFLEGRPQREQRVSWSHQFLRWCTVTGKTPARSRASSPRFPACRTRSSLRRRRRTNASIRSNAYSSTSAMRPCATAPCKRSSNAMAATRRPCARACT
ncbi:MAG: polysaccharide deacetylase family protein [Planctomycetota bacterium]